MHKPTYCLKLTVAAQNYEAALATLYEFGTLGCEEKSSDPDISLDAFFPDEKTAAAARETLQNLSLASGTVVETADRDWNAAWRETMKPARLARGYWVSPLWLPPPESARHWIRIEPKMAFGTGHHETTRLAAQAMITVKKRLERKRVLDIGAGSGVLCFAAGLCGARFAAGLEIDPCCRENLAENRRNNRTPGGIGFLIGGIEAIRRAPRFDLAVMNMILTESAPLLDAVASLLTDTGILIWSGVLTDECRKASLLAEKSGFSLERSKTENEWWCGTFSLHRPVCG